MGNAAGASARLEAQRRTAKREKAIRTKHPRLGGLILALTEEPQTTRAWTVGARGEERVGKLLDDVAGIVALHDRRLPGRTKGNVDHIAVTPGGVIVIDSKAYSGVIEVSRDQLRVKGRDRTKLVTGVARQADAISPLLGYPKVGSHLCFVEGEFGFFARTRCGETYVTSLRGLRKRLQSLCAGDPILDVAATARALEELLPPAAP